MTEDKGPGRPFDDPVERSEIRKALKSLLPLIKLLNALPVFVKFVAGGATLAGAYLVAKQLGLF